MFELFQTLNFNFKNKKIEQICSLLGKKLQKLEKRLQVFPVI
jgi:hypothetical protein